MGDGNISEVRKIVNYMRKNGVLCFRNANFEIKISRQAFKLPRHKIKATSDKINTNMPDLTLWSAPDFPESAME